MTCLFKLNDLRETPGGGVHNMLRVRVCAARMGGFLGPKFSKQGSLFRQIFLKLSAKFHHKIGYVRKFR